MKYQLKQLIKKSLNNTGLSKFLWPLLPNGLYVLNYHRIGQKNMSLFDRDVFSCTSPVLEQQLLQLKQHFTVVNIAELVKIIANKQVSSQRYALISFDDGYLDNYTEAFPLLKKHQLPAVFFLPTSLIGSKELPWWDEMAFILRKNIGASIALPDDSCSIFIDPMKPDQAIQQYIYRAKRLQRYSTQQTLDFLRERYPVSQEQFTNVPSMFMSWIHVKDLLDNGMDIGSHTINHPMLAQLSDVDQRVELEGSKLELEKNLGSVISSVAYPIGRKHCYTLQTKNIAADVGYLLGFNNEPRINRKLFDQFDICRFSVNHDQLTNVILNSW